MSNRAPFKMADLTRAIKGAEKAGLTVGRVEIDPDGKIAVYRTDDGCGTTRDIDKMLGIK